MPDLNSLETSATELATKIEELKSFASDKGLDLDDEIKVLSHKLAALNKNLYEHITPWQRVVTARARTRPRTLDYLSLIFDDFMEMHGDRCYGDDAAMICGIVELNGQPLTVIGQEKGHNLKENTRRNFGMPHPEGYRKALRAMQQAEKFHRPIICFIDTPGAYPGADAEERGQARALADNLMQMSMLRTPIICIVTGEGSSGGALAISVGDRIAMLSNAVYSVISPEGCASILWKDAKRSQEAAAKLRMTARDLLEFGVIDDILEEPQGNAQLDPKGMAAIIQDYITATLAQLVPIPLEQLIEARYAKFRKIGVWHQG